MSSKDREQGKVTVVLDEKSKVPEDVCAWIADHVQDASYQFHDIPDVLDITYTADAPPPEGKHVRH